MGIVVFLVDVAGRLAGVRASVLERSPLRASGSVSVALRRRQQPVRAVAAV